jgi:hypothetical protein
MGQKATCHARLGSQSGDGIAELETDFVQFRSNTLRFKWTFPELKQVIAVNGALRLQSGAGTAVLELGDPAAAKWAGKILNPPTRLDKLGIQPEHSVLLDGTFEPPFLKEIKRNPQTDVSSCDLVLLAAERREDLAAVPQIARKMRKDAALWIVYPKGVEPIREGDVIGAGRAAGLKDVKVMRFSDRETALKFVVPLATRRSSGNNRAPSPVRPAR